MREERFGLVGPGRPVRPVGHRENNMTNKTQRKDNNKTIKIIIEYIQIVSFSLISSLARGFGLMPFFTEPHFFNYRRREENIKNKKVAIPFSSGDLLLLSNILSLYNPFQRAAGFLAKARGLFFRGRDGMGRDTDEHGWDLFYLCFFIFSKSIIKSLWGNYLWGQGFISISKIEDV